MVRVGEYDQLNGRLGIYRTQSEDGRTLGVKGRGFLRKQGNFTKEKWFL